MEVNKLRRTREIVSELFKYNIEVLSTESKDNYRLSPSGYPAFGSRI
jgi:hypothetical protein